MGVGEVERWGYGALPGLFRCAILAQNQLLNLSVNLQSLPSEHPPVHRSIASAVILLLGLAVICIEQDAPGAAHSATNRSCWLAGPPGSGPPSRAAVHSRKFKPPDQVPSPSGLQPRTHH